MYQKLTTKNFTYITKKSRDGTERNRMNGMDLRLWGEAKRGEQREHEPRADEAFALRGAHDLHLSVELVSEVVVEVFLQEI